MVILPLPFSVAVTKPPVIHDNHRTGTGDGDGYIARLGAGHGDRAGGIAVDGHQTGAGMLAARTWPLFTMAMRPVPDWVVAVTGRHC